MTGQIQIGEILLAAYGNEDPFFEVDFIPFLADTWAKARALNEARPQQRDVQFGLQEGVCHIIIIQKTTGLSKLLILAYGGC